EAEPLLFIGQVNCAALSGLPGAELLLTAGLLAFFGDHDAVTGCFPFAEGGVYHWSDIDRLAPTQAPIEPAEAFLSCAVVPQASGLARHPQSRHPGGQRRVRRLQQTVGLAGSGAERPWAIRHRRQRPPPSAGRQLLQRPGRTVFRPRRIALLCAPRG